MVSGIDTQTNKQGKLLRGEFLGKTAVKRLLQWLDLSFHKPASLDD
jgi:hypothetical protein